MARPGFPAGTRRLALRGWVPYVLLVVMCLLSVYAAAYVSSTAESRQRDEFYADAAETRKRIEVRLDTYLEVVRAGTALLAASNEIHHADFRAFVRRLELRERYPGLEGIGFSQRVAGGDLASFVRALDLDGVTRLRVQPAGPRPEYQPIVFVEPMDSPADGIGFDLATDPAQREAMDRARDSGHVALSARVSEASLVHGIVADSVVLYAPVYRTGAATGTIEERQRALHGFVFSPIRAALLLEDVARGAARPVTFEVYDGLETDATALIHASAPAGAAAYQSSGPLSIAGRDWLLVVKSADRAPGPLPPAARNALAGGLVLSLLLFVITRTQIRAWETARRHESELSESEQALRARECQLRELVVRERTARAQAQEADRAKDDFLVGLSHELRTPMNVVLGWLAMLKTGAVREERRADAFDVIERNARLQARLIEDLLDLSRILLGKMAIDPQPLAVATVISSVVDSLRPSAVAKGVQLEVPAIARLGVILGDSARVHQIVWNLVSNAIKFTPAGGSVAVELTGDSASVELRVRDTGVGITPEFLPHVFDRFRQADTSTTRAHSGLGLGLAITRHLVELHDGSVEAQSEGRNRGALFVVRFPAAPVPAGGDDVREATAPHTLGDLRVLAVDDDRDTRELLAEALRASGRASARPSPPAEPSISSFVNPPTFW